MGEHFSRLTRFTFHLAIFTMGESMLRLVSIIQAEAGRRSREAGVQQAMENGLRSCMHIKK